MHKTKLIGSLFALALMVGFGSAAHAGSMKGSYGSQGSGGSNYSQSQDSHNQYNQDQGKQYGSAGAQQEGKQDVNSQNSYSQGGQNQSNHTQPSYSQTQTKDYSAPSYQPPKQDNYKPAVEPKLTQQSQKGDSKNNPNQSNQSYGNQSSQNYGSQNKNDGQKNNKVDDQKFDTNRNFGNNDRDHIVVVKKVEVVKVVRVTDFRNQCDMRNFWNGKSWNWSMMNRFRGCFCPQGFGQGWNQGFGMNQSDWNWMMQHFCKNVRVSSFNQDCDHNFQPARPTVFFGNQGFTAPSNRGGGNIVIDGVNSITGPFSVNTNEINVGGGFGTAQLAAANEITGPFSVNTNLINVLGGFGNTTVSALNHLTGPFSVNRNVISTSGHRSDSWNGGKFNGFNSAGTRFASFRNVNNVDNNISVSANTGGNNANFNTIGGGIQTGDITTMIGVQNE